MPADDLTPERLAELERDTQLVAHELGGWRVYVFFEPPAGHVCIGLSSESEEDQSSAVEPDEDAWLGLVKLAREAHALRARVAALEDRLEITWVWQSVGDGSEGRVEIPPAERGFGPGSCDGIDCRDETIKGQDGLIDRLRAEVASLKAKLLAGEAERVLARLERPSEGVLEAGKEAHESDVDPIAEAGRYGGDLQGREWEYVGAMRLALAAMLDKAREEAAGG